VQHQPIVQGRPIESLSKGYPLVSNGIAAAIIVYHLEAALLEHTWIELSSDVKRPDGPWCAVFGGASNGLCRYGPSRLEALLAACESITDA
jgi:hypothetical protein